MRAGPIYIETARVKGAAYCSNCVIGNFHVLRVAGERSEGSAIPSGQGRLLLLSDAIGKTLQITEIHFFSRLCLLVLVTSNDCSPNDLLSRSIGAGIPWNGGKGCLLIDALCLLAVLTVFD